MEKWDIYYVPMWKFFVVHAEMWHYIYKVRIRPLKAKNLKSRSQLVLFFFRVFNVYIYKYMLCALCSDNPRKCMQYATTYNMDSTGTRPMILVCRVLLGESKVTRSLVYFHGIFYCLWAKRERERERERERREKRERERERERAHHTHTHTHTFTYSYTHIHAYTHTYVAHSFTHLQTYKLTLKYFNTFLY